MAQVEVMQIIVEHQTKEYLDLVELVLVLMEMLGGVVLEQLLLLPEIHN